MLESLGYKIPDDKGETFSQISCGVHLLYGTAINEAEELLKMVAQRKCFDPVTQKTYPYACASLVFSDADFNSDVSDGKTYGGRNFALYIKEHTLGHLTESPPVRNPNSGNTIRTWIWDVDWSALNSWYAERTK